MHQFETDTNAYAQYRPQYPESVAQTLAGLVKYRGVAWDAGTGTGIMATELAKYFNLICATDILPEMLRLAPANKGVLYSCQPAEQTDFPDDFVDLIVAAQSAHWFQLDLFYQECKRVAREGAAIAIIGYSSPTLPSILQPIYDYIEHQLLGNYWSPKIEILDNGNQQIDFPFQEIEVRLEPIHCNWTIEELTGFITSWSATRNFLADGKANEMQDAINELNKAWPQASKPIALSFPLCSRIGYI